MFRAFALFRRPLTRSNTRFQCVRHARAFADAVAIEKSNQRVELWGELWGIYRAELAARARHTADVLALERARVAIVADRGSIMSDDEIDASAFDALPEDARRTMVTMGRALDAVERATNAFAAFERASLERTLRPLERAEMHCEAARAIVSLFAMYLRAQGVDDTKHACAKERSRVERAAEKLERVKEDHGDGARGERVGGRKVKIDVEAAGRMIASGAGGKRDGGAGELLRAALRERDAEADKGNGDVASPMDVAKAKAKKRAATKGGEEKKGKKGRA